MNVIIEDSDSEYEYNDIHSESVRYQHYLPRLYQYYGNQNVGNFARGNSYYASDFEKEGERGDCMSEFFETHCIWDHEEIEKVRINEVGEHELLQLPGIGECEARIIVEFRKGGHITKQLFPHLVCILKLSYPDIDEVKLFQNIEFDDGVCLIQSSFVDSNLSSTKQETEAVYSRVGQHYEEIPSTFFVKSNGSDCHYNDSDCDFVCCDDVEMSNYSEFHQNVTESRGQIPYYYEQCHDNQEQFHDSKGGQSFSGAGGQSVLQSDTVIEPSAEVRQLFRNQPNSGLNKIQDQLGQILKKLDSQEGILNSTTDDVKSLTLNVEANTANYESLLSGLNNLKSDISGVKSDVSDLETHSRESRSFSKNVNFNRDGSRSPSGDRSGGCFICGVVGHLARDCPKRVRTITSEHEAEDISVAGQKDFQSPHPAHEG